MSRKVLFIGGIKSGKSKNAEQYVLKNFSSRPTYLATTEFIDDEMKLRIEAHRQNRSEKFETVEEPLKLYEAVSTCQNPVLVECVSMWINNMLYHGFGFEEMREEMQRALKLDRDMVFVLNDVGSGVIPDNALAREFADISGRLSQLIASECGEVYHTVAGISTRIK